MTDRTKHTAILSAYLNRIPLKQLEQIVQAQRDAWHASLNLGANAQDRTQKYAEEITEQAVRHITNYDISLIESQLQRVMAEKSSPKLVGASVQTDEGTKFLLIDACDTNEAMDAISQSFDQLDGVTLFEGDDVLGMLSSQYSGIAELATI